MTLTLYQINTKLGCRNSYSEGTRYYDIFKPCHTVNSWSGHNFYNKHPAIQTTIWNTTYKFASTKSENA